MSNLKFKVFRVFINVVAILYLVFDEVFIYLSNKISAMLSLMPKFADIKEYWKQVFVNMNKYIVLLLLLSNLVFSEILGLLSFMLLSKGMVISFIIMYIFKFFPFFIMNFIFNSSKDQLLSIKWFNYCYYKFCDISDYLKQTEIAKKIKEVTNLIKVKLRLI